MFSFVHASGYLHVCISKVWTITWLRGVSQYFKLCQDALKSIVGISLQCLYKHNPIYLRESCMSVHSRQNQPEHKSVVVVAPSQTRGPSATVSDGGQKWKSAKEIKNRTSVFHTSLCTLLLTSNLWFRVKICFRDLSSVKSPICFLNSSTVWNCSVCGNTLFHLFWSSQMIVSFDGL